LGRERIGVFNVLRGNSGASRGCDLPKLHL
jgi:hypothetical protein